MKDEHYLIPIGRIRSIADDCISLNSLIKQLNNCSNKLNIIIIDACRADKKNGAFKAKALDGMRKEISEKAATSSLSTTTGSVKPQFLLILSCDPGQLSYDGHNSHSNSRFTEVLLKHLSEPNLRHDDMMHRVTRELLDKKSKNKQRPWVHSCLHEPFYFNDGSYIFSCLCHNDQSHFYLYRIGRIRQRKYGQVSVFWSVQIETTIISQYWWWLSYNGC